MLNSSYLSQHYDPIVNIFALHGMFCTLCQHGAPITCLVSQLMGNV